MLILCEDCITQCPHHDDWMVHLLTPEHQKKVKERISYWSDESTACSVVFTFSNPCNQQGNQVTGYNVLWHCSSFGLVADIFVSPDMEFVVVQMDKRDHAADILELPEGHKIAGVIASVCPRNSLKPSEWEALFSRKDQDQRSQEKTDNSELNFFVARHTRMIKNTKGLSLDDQMNIFVQEVRLKVNEIDFRNKLVAKLQEILLKEFPHSCLSLYGSSVTLVGDSQSTIRLFFDAYRFDTTGQAPSPKRVAAKVERLLSEPKNGFRCKRIKIIEIFNEPAIRFYYSGAHCVITVSNIVPVQRSKLLLFLMTLDDRVRILFTVIRYWAQYQRVSEPKFLSNYSLYLLLMVFLVDRRIIPSVVVLQSLCLPREVDSWNVGFCEDKAKVLKLLSLYRKPDVTQFERNAKTGEPGAKAILLLLKDFFHMYAHSDLQTKVIAPLVGDSIEKSIFIPGKETSLPHSLDRYKDWIGGRSTNHRLNIFTPLCVQDPFMLATNLTSEVDERILVRFQFLCSDMSENIDLLLNTSNHQPSLMNVFGTGSGLERAHAIIDNLKKRSRSPLTENVQPSTKRSSTVNNTIPVVQSQHCTVTVSSSSLTKTSTFQSTTLSSSIAATPAYSNMTSGVSINPNCQWQYEPQRNNVPPPMELFPQQSSYPQYHEPGPGYYAPPPPQPYPQNNWNNGFAGAGLLGTGPSIVHSSTQFYNPGPGVQSAPSYQFAPPNSNCAPLPVKKVTKGSPKGKSNVRSPNLIPVLVKTNASSGESSTKIAQTKKATGTPIEIDNQSEDSDEPCVIKIVSLNTITDPASPPERTNAPSRPLPLPVSPSPSTFTLKDYTKHILFNVQGEFLHLYATHLGNIVKDKRFLKSRMSYLWATFLKDFFKTVWSKCFMLKPIVLDPKDVHDVNHNPVTSFTFPVIQHYTYPETSNPLLKKFMKLPNQVSYSLAFLIKGNKNISLCRQKFNAETEVRPNMNPLDREETITKIIFEKESRSVCVPKYEFVAKLEVSVNTTGISASMILKELHLENDVPKQTFRLNSNSIGALPNVIQRLVPDYLNFRLREWLEII